MLIHSSDKFVDYVKEYDRRVVNGIKEKNEGEHGDIDLVVEDWGGTPTYEGAAALAQRFDLNLPRSAEELQTKYSKVSDLLSEIETLVTDKVVRPLNNLSEVTKVGGTYFVGWDGRKFALMFAASPGEVAELVDDRDDLKSAATIQERNAKKLACVRDALARIKSVDFGHDDDTEGAKKLDKAINTLTRCGLDGHTRDVRLALKTFISDKQASREYLYGPTGHGSNRGALYDLTVLADSFASGKDRSLMMGSAAKFVTYNGAVYRLAYDLPKNMKGVSKCKAEDIDPDKDRSEQEWCVYTSKGKLRGRHKDKKDALRQKVFMINMHWQKGKGKNNPAGNYWRKKKK